MPDLAFTQTKSRSLFGPAIGALLLLIAGGAALMHFSAPGDVPLAIGNAAILETTTHFKSDSIVIGVDHSETVLFVAVPIHLQNKRNAPVTLDGSQIVFTNPDGAQLTAKAMSPADLASVRQSFPALVPLITQPQLPSETVLAPQQTIDGTAVFSLQIPKSMWDARRSADLQINLYQLPAATAPIPKTSAQ